MSTEVQPHHKILIIGGGFGGVKAALKLCQVPNAHVTLISQTAVFSYYPQLYHAATGGSRAEAVIPLTQLFAAAAVELVTATITTLNAEAKTVTASDGQEFAYDELVLSLGSVTNYFGIAGLEKFAYNIKTIDGAERFKQHLHQQLIAERRPDVNYVVVGGGATGVELSGALAEYLHQITTKHGVTTNFRIDLVEASPRLLPHSSARTAAKVKRRLERLGINIMTGAEVEAETAESLQIKGQSIASRTVVWTAGVANNPFYQANASVLNLGDHGKVTVDDHMQARESVYVIGDNADTKYAGLAQTAVADGTFVAADIARKLRGVTRPRYHQSAPFPVIPIGDRWAAATIGPLEFYGFGGWMLRRLGDFVAYADIESLPGALKVWRLDGRREDDCPICGQPTAA
ncbi:FAD-dependent oxidoreductase [Candidatus Saccharibacteria bacterium]|nr:FAD-dependent oxidoreductase [Candidatus Saccharibacteria bacterium]